MMNGYNGWQGDGYNYGWDGSMMGGHPYIGGDVMAVIVPMLFFCLVIALALVAFQIWLYYRIFAKAGYNGWWSMLALIPGVGTLVVMLVLAFDNWPIHRGEAGGSPMTGPAPAASSVAAQASAYNPAGPGSAGTPVPGSYTPPVAPTSPATPVAPAEPPIPAPAPAQEVAVPAPAEPIVEDAPRSDSAS